MSNAYANKATNTTNRGSFDAGARAQKSSDLNQTMPRKTPTSPMEANAQPIHKSGETEKHFGQKGPTIPKRTITN